MINLAVVINEAEIISRKNFENLLNSVVNFFLIGNNEYRASNHLRFVAQEGWALLVKAEKLGRLTRLGVEI